MKFGKSCGLLLAAAAILLTSAAAHAAPQVFFGNAPAAAGTFPADSTSPNYAPITERDAFLAVIDLATKVSENFENRTPGSISTTQNQLSVFSGGTLSQGAPAGNPFFGAELKEGPQSNGRFNTTNGTSSGRWIETDSNFTITLDQAIGAFGFFGTDFGDFDGGLEIAIFKEDGDQIDNNIFTDKNGNPLQLLDANSTTNSGSLLFFGYASEQLFNKIVFTINQSSTPNDDPNLPPFPVRDILGFDDLVIGNLKAPPTGTVPEPGSLALAGLALFAAGWARKARPAA